MLIEKVFYRLSQLVSIPKLYNQKTVSILNCLTQISIIITGGLVRLTSSGLGCPSWPKCLSESFIPNKHIGVHFINQLVEFSNRILAFVVLLIACISLLICIRSKRSSKVLVYALLVPFSTLFQAFMGAITVQTGLIWWSVIIHFLTSILIVWVSVLLLININKTDFILNICLIPKCLKQLTLLSVVTLAILLFTGVFVASSGPHTGDQNSTNNTIHLHISISSLVSMHMLLSIIYLLLLILLNLSLITIYIRFKLNIKIRILIIFVCFQILIGFLLIYLRITEVVAVTHIIGAISCIVFTAILWTSRYK